MPHPRIMRSDETTEIVEEPNSFVDNETVFKDNPGNSTALDALTAALNAKIESANLAAMPEQQLTLSAKISDDGPVIPSGVVWRVFDSKADDKGELALLAKSTSPIADFNLKPGDYVVHVAYGRSQATDTVHVDPAPTSRTIVLDSGGLRLSAAISGDIPIDPKMLTFEIYATGTDRTDRILVADDVAPGDIINLNAGVYNVISKFGKINAIVRADLRVDPGQLTEAVLYHKAQQVTFRLASETGGEAIADVDWVIKTIDGDTVYSSFGAFPSTILIEGDYSVLAKRGSNVYNRDFSVHAGTPTEIEVLTTVY